MLIEISDKDPINILGARRSYEQSVSHGADESITDNVSNYYIISLQMIKCYYLLLVS